jgi:phosphate:Na+ symporter
MFLGLGIMLLALKLIVAASAPMRESLIVQQIFLSLDKDLLLAVILAAAIAWASHSSLATVLLVISLASTGALDLRVAFAFVLGANIGGAIPPLVATLGANRQARLPPLGNLLFRVFGVLLVLPFVDVIANWLSPLEVGNARQIANFHMFFNIGLAVLFFPLIDRMVSLTGRLVPKEKPIGDRLLPRELDTSAFENPLVALLNAEREVLRMGEVVERMLRNTREQFL